VHVKPPAPSWWDGQKSRRLHVFDVVVLALLALLALASVITGALATRDLSLRPAQSVAQVLAQTEEPKLLADARLLGESGETTTLMSRTRRRLSLVTVPPPLGAVELVRALFRAFGKKHVVVVLPAGTLPLGVRRSFDNAGMTKVPFFVDANGTLVRSGRVVQLPVTFLIDKAGTVLHWVTGAEPHLLGRLKLRYELERGRTK
jgi:hypothetical protein